jgi:hypothetical protein
VNVAPPRLNIVRASDVKSEPVSWIWPQRIALGKFTLLEGNPSDGKSTLIAAISTAITRGIALPGADGPRPLGRVLIGSAEEGYADTIVPRLQAHQCDLDRVEFLDGVGRGIRQRPVSLPKDLRALEREVVERGVTLVVLDPMVSYYGAGIDAYRDRDARQVTDGLAKIAQRTGAGILGIRHLTKNLRQPALYRGGGSIGIIASARIALLVGRDPDDQEQFVLATTKSNLGALAPSLSFRIEPSPHSTTFGVVSWIGESPHRADDLTQHRPRTRGATQHDRAVALLQQRLPCAVSDLKDAADALAISWRTVESAKSVLGVVSRQVPVDGKRGRGPSTWDFPRNGPQRVADPNLRTNGAPGPSRPRRKAT